MQDSVKLGADPGGERAGRAYREELFGLFRAFQSHHWHHVSAIPEGPANVTGLRSSKAKVAEIAFRVGYESPAQFSHEYARNFGCPPREDRRSLAAE
ncbi:helix-turn-helix domain-containing protein [Roseicyclus sp.]